MDASLVGKFACRTCKRHMMRVRGCCSTCYSRYLEAVKAGEVTWAELEAKGFVIPKKPKVALTRLYRTKAPTGRKE